jgi:hypothetical protein
MKQFKTKAPSHEGDKPGRSAPIVRAEKLKGKGAKEHYSQKKFNRHGKLAVLTR